MQYYIQLHIGPRMYVLCVCVCECVYVCVYMCVCVCVGVYGVCNI